MFSDKEIPNAALRPEHLPAPDADWVTLGEFALTFHGYNHWPDCPSCGDIANVALDHYFKTGELPQDLKRLRSCLFFEQRRWRHFGDEPTGEDMKYIRTLVEAIRQQVERKAAQPR